MNGDLAPRVGGDDAMGPRFSIRHAGVPRFWKIFVIFWFVWTTTFVIGGVAGGIPIAAVLIAVVLLGGFAWFLWRRPCLGVYAYDDELVIRDALRERRVARGEIAGFHIGSPGGGGALGRPVVLLVRRDGGRLPLWVTATTPMNHKSQPTEKALKSLSDWLNDSAKP